MGFQQIWSYPINNNLILSVHSSLVEIQEVKYRIYLHTDKALVI